MSLCVTCCSLPQIKVNINIAFDSFLNKTYCTKNVLCICVGEVFLHSAGNLSCKNIVRLHEKVFTLD